MELNIFKNLKVCELVVFASLPDMGRVGGLASSYLAQNLKTSCIAQIISNEKPWVSYADGVVKTVTDTYRIYYNKHHKLLIFTGDSQPQESTELYRLCNKFLDYVKSIGKIKRLYSAGGYLSDDLAGAPKVRGVVNNTDLKKILAKADIDTIGNEINSISWFNGLILGLAAERNVDALGLFGEISDSTISQPLAAKSIVKAFARIENIKLDTKLLDREYEIILEDIKKQKELNKFGS